MKFAFYILLVALPGEPSYQWRVEGGYDSCALMENMLRRYNKQVTTECVSGAEWEARGKPGRMPGLVTPQAYQ